MTTWDTHYNALSVHHHHHHHPPPKTLVGRMGRGMVDALSFLLDLNTVSVQIANDLNYPIYLSFCHISRTDLLHNKVTSKLKHWHDLPISLPCIEIRWILKLDPLLNDLPQVLHGWPWAIRRHVSVYHVTLAVAISKIYSYFSFFQSLTFLCYYCTCFSSRYRRN